MPQLLATVLLTDPALQSILRAELAPEPLTRVCTIFFSVPGRAAVPLLRLLAPEAHSRMPQLLATVLLTDPLGSAGRC